MRVAIYFTPGPNDPLTVAASAWLGRDAFSGAEFEPPSGILPGDWHVATAQPRRYGFHATLKAPFTPTADTSLADIESDLSHFCLDTRPVRIGGLRLERLGHFLALVPAGDAPGLLALAATIVERFDRHRQSPDSAELAKRRATGLTPPQEDSLVRWGYPFTHADFRFHMTLAGPVDPARHALLADLIGRDIGPLLDRPLVIDALALFLEPEPGAAFAVRSRHLLPGLAA